MSITRVDPGIRYSAAVIHGNTVYLAGQVAKKMAGMSVGEQTTEILENIEALLIKCGSSKSKMLSVSIFLSDISTFAEMNVAYDAWVPKDAMPVRATVEAKIASPDGNVANKILAKRNEAVGTSVRPSHLNSLNVAACRRR